MINKPILIHNTKMRKLVWMKYIKEEIDSQVTKQRVMPQYQIKNMLNDVYCYLRYTSIIQSSKQSKNNAS